MFSLLLACKQCWNLDEVYMLFLLCLNFFFFFLSWRLLVWRNFCKPRIWHVSLLVCKHSNLEKTGYFLLRLCFIFFSSWWLLMWRNCRCRFGLNTSLLSCKHWSQEEVYTWVLGFACASSSSSQIGEWVQRICKNLQNLVCFLSLNKVPKGGRESPVERRMSFRSNWCFSFVLFSQFLFYKLVSCNPRGTILTSN